MNPRKPLASWQQFAQAFWQGETGFAPSAGLRDDRCVPGALLAPQCLGQDCYPFPTLWPDSDGVRPFFVTGFVAGAAPLWRLVASCVRASFFQFASLLETVESMRRTTNKRGSSKCGNLSFLSSFSPCRWPAACRTLRRAVWLALRGGAAIADLTGNNAVTGAVIGGLAGAATCGVNIGLPPCY